MDNFNEVVYFLKFILPDTQKWSALLRRGNQWLTEGMKEHIQPKVWHKGEKSGWLIDFSVCLPAGGFWGAGTHQGFPVLNMLTVDHYLA